MILRWLYLLKYALRLGRADAKVKAMPSIGSLIYSGVIPLVKMYLTILFGYVFARKGMFPQAAAKGASFITMNLALPALIFSSIVPAFTPANAFAIGPLALLAIMYILIGLLGGLAIREVCYVPRNFWQGIVVASGLSNWSSLPTAVVISITQSSPFDPETDTALGISFISIFILIYHIFFWVCGLAHSLSWDYAPGVPQGEAANTRALWREKPIGGFVWRHVLKTKHDEGESQDSRSADYAQVEHAGRHSPRVRDEEDIHTELPPSIPPPPVQSEPTSWSKRLLAAFAVVVTPINATVAISLLIALVDPLKALFVGFKDGASWKGPDGKPPLAFFIDTAELIGAVTVPMTLILLGVYFARMSINLSPKSGLPVFALLWVCAVKMILLPIIGVFVTRAMITGGLIDPGSKILIFVAIFVSGTPSAINQLIVASSYSDGEQGVLSALLFLQYIFMPFSSSTLSAIAFLLI